MHKTRRTRTQWLGLVRAWRRSRLPAGDFAAKRGLDPAQLRWWAWRLGKADATEATPITFVEIPPPAASSTPDIVELTLSDGRVLRFPAHLDPAQIGALVGALEARR